MSEIELLHIECPHCGKRFKVKHDLAGHKVKCAACGGAIHIPAAEEEEDVFAALAAAQEAPPALEADEIPRQCPTCGATLTAAAVVCVECGADLEPAA